MWVHAALRRDRVFRALRRQVIAVALRAEVICWTPEARPVVLPNKAVIA